MAELEEQDFFEVAKKLLISQYQQPNFLSLFRIITKLFDQMQSTNFELRDKFWLQDATGEQLDFIGRLWDVKRGALSDTDYRIAIYAKIGTTSSGTIPEIKTIIKQAYGASFVSYTPEYPAAFRIRTDGGISYEQLEVISPAGVLGLLYCYLYDTEGNNIIDANGDYIGGVNCGNTPVPILPGEFWPVGFWADGFWPDGFWSTET